MEYRVEFVVLMNHMGHNPIGVVCGLCKAVDTGYYLPQMNQQDKEYH